MLLTAFSASAQKREELFDISFKPAKNGAFYYVTTEKKDSGWYREAYYYTQGSMAMKGWYKDEAGKVPHGPMLWFHPTKFLKSKGEYIDGKKEGVWLGYNDEGILLDSSNYRAGRRTGVSMKWHKDGMPSDSLNFDGEGNGVEVSFFDDGSVASAGRWTQDTLKKGRWKYYHKNGNVMAIQDYENGKLTLCNCWDEAGVQLDTSLCGEKEAEIIGGVNAWRRFLEQNLVFVIESAAKVLKPGQYTITVRFLVEKDGRVTDVKPLTAFGHGIEESVVRIFNRAPRWTPGRQFGRAVRSYHTQPITFAIQSQ